MNRMFFRQLENSAEALLARIEGKKIWLLGSFSLLYFVGTCLLATRKVLWNDELYTLYISRLPTLTDVWNALLSGGEQNPPLFYVITRASFALFGINHFSIRLPEVIGFWVMCLCLFYFVARNLRPVYGLMAALFPLLTGAYYYASEARPYGLVLGFSALALVSWQSATRVSARAGRLLAIFCLTICLAAAVSNHYYAVLVFVAIGLGESVRTVLKRQVDIPIWTALCLAATPLLLVLPLIKRARSYGGTFWSPAAWLSAPDFYSKLLAPSVFIIFLLLLWAAMYLIASGAQNKNSTLNAGPPWHEIAAAIGFAVIPILGVLLGKLVTGAFTDRYVITAIIGISVLFAFAADKLLNSAGLAGALFVLLLGGWIGVGELRRVGEVTQAARDQASAIHKLQAQTEGEMPIVASDAHTVVDLSYYAPPDIASRLVYLADPEISLRQLSYNSVDRGMIDLIKPWFKLNVQDYRQYISAQRQFFVYGSVGFLCWLLPQLEADKMQIEMKYKDGENFLFFVHSRELSATPSTDNKITIR